MRVRTALDLYGIKPRLVVDDKVDLGTIVDLGPEGGDRGGNLVFEGTPDEIVNCEGSYTGFYLKKELQKEKYLSSHPLDE